jgi:hypothetical protein
MATLVGAVLLEPLVLRDAQQCPERVLHMLARMVLFCKEPQPMTQSSTDSSLVERLRAVETALASDRPYAASVSSEAASRISTLERELEDARALNEQNFGRTLVQANHDLRSQLDRVTSPQYLEEALSKLRVVDEARLTAAEAKVARMGEALNPFASEASRYGAYGDGSQRAWLNCTVADLRAARSALQSENAE